MKKYIDENQLIDMKNELYAEISTTRRNLAKNDSLIAYSFTGTDNYGIRLNDYRWELNSSVSYAGIQINGNLFELNETYTLSYRFKKISGILEAIGGHSQGFEILKVNLDGENLSSENNDSFGTIIKVKDDSNEHTVEIVLRLNDLEALTHLYIQPNRGTTTPIKVQIWDIKLEKGNGATYWTPAPEDFPIADTLLALETRIKILEGNL